LTTYVSHGSAATDLRGGDSFNSSFLQILSEFNREKNMKIGPLVTKFCHLALGGPVIMTYHV